MLRTAVRLYTILLVSLVVCTPDALAQRVMQSMPVFVRNAGQVRAAGASAHGVPLYIASLPQGVVGIRTNGISFAVQRGATVTRTDFDFADGAYTLAATGANGIINRYDERGTLHRSEAYTTLVFRHTQRNKTISIGITTNGLNIHSTSALALRPSSPSFAIVNGALDINGVVSVPIPSSIVTTATPDNVQQPNFAWDATDNGVTVALNFITPTTSASYFGGASLDSATSATGDGTSMYVCGVTTSANFPATAGTHQQSLQGGRDAFIAKFDSRGSRIWATYFGGAGDDAATGIALSNTLVAVCGTTNSKSNFIQGSGYKSTFLGGNTDGFLSTLNSASGQIQNSTYIGGNSIDACTDVCIMPNGNIACTGTTFSDNIDANGHQKNQGGASDAFIIVLSPTLSALQWSTYYGSDDLEYGGGIIAAPNGSIFICGTTASYNANNIISTTIGEGNDLVEFFDGFLVKFSAQGTREWGRFYGGKGYDYATRIALTSSSVIIIGYTNTGTSPDRFIATADGAQTDFGGGINDGFIASFNIDSGKRIWGTYQGGSGDDRCTGITATPNGDVFVTGMSNSANFPLFPKDSPAPAGGYDAFMGYYKADGKQRIASVLFGGSGDDRGAGLMRLNDNTILLCGTTTSTNLPVSGGGQQSNAGGSDIFLASFVDYSILDVEGEPQQPAWSVVPNPAHTSITVRGMEDGSHYDVCSLLGISMLRGNVISGTPINISALPAGYYFIRITTAQGTPVSIPFVKE